MVRKRWNARADEARIAHITGTACAIETSDPLKAQLPCVMSRPEIGHEKVAHGYGMMTADHRCHIPAGC